MIGEILQKRRTELGITLKDMAATLGTTKQRLEQIEKDVTKNPGLSICRDICKAYKLPMKTLTDNIE
jgi:transcriptional regulator with XRE-family HTH domain